MSLEMQKTIRNTLIIFIHMLPTITLKKWIIRNMLITTSLSDNRVLFDEPAKFTAKLKRL